MCRNCAGEGVGRRDFLKLGATGLAAVAVAGVSGPAGAAGGQAATLTPDEALAALKSGNERYVGNPELCSSAAPTAASRPS